MSKSWVANLFTSANIAFGTASIILSLNGDIEAAAFCILAAMVSDALDGRIARVLGTGRGLWGLSWILFATVHPSASRPGFCCMRPSFMVWADGV